MVGQLQRPGAASPRKASAKARADEDDGQTIGGGPQERRRSGRKSRASPKESVQQPPQLPLDEAEAELCERLTELLAIAPRRCCEQEHVTPVEISDRIATLAEVVPEPAELPPLVELPVVETAPGKATVKSIPWVQRSRRERLKTAVGYSTAWIVTLGVIAMTVTGATVATLGAGKSFELATIFWTHGADTASASLAVLKGLLGL